MSLAVLFHFLYTQHISGINISIIRSLRQCCCITTSEVLFCRDGGFSVSVNVWCLSITPWRLLWFAGWMSRAKINEQLYNKHFEYAATWPRLWTSILQIIDSNLQGEMDKHHKFTLTLNPPTLQNKPTDVVIQQHNRKFLMMAILMSETCRVYKKWNKIASDIKLVFYSSTKFDVCGIVHHWHNKINNQLGAAITVY